jgi:hypothetical protein
VIDSFVKVPRRVLLLGMAMVPIVVIAVNGTRRSIERRVSAEIRADLDHAGHGWARIQLVGRRVSLVGTAPTEEAATEALVVAAAARCDAWIAQVTCARRVTGGFTTDLEWPTIRATVKYRVLTLSGEVPDEATRWAIVDRARVAVERGYIQRYVDDLQILGHGAPVGVDATAALVSRMSALCESGGASLEHGVVSIDCVVPDSLAGELRTLAAQPLSSGYRGHVRITVAGTDSATID